MCSSWIKEKFVGRKILEENSLITLGKEKITFQKGESSGKSRKKEKEGGYERDFGRRREVASFRKKGEDKRSRRKVGQGSGSGKKRLEGGALKEGGAKEPCRFQYWKPGRG